MKVFIRTDSSSTIGHGHVMRCVALAEELRERKASVAFLCRGHPGNLNDYIEKKGFPVHSLPVDQVWMAAKVTGNGLPAHAAWLGTHWESDAAEVEAILAREREQGCVDWLIVDHYALDAGWESRMRSYVKKIMAVDDIADRSHDCDLLLDQNIYQDRYNGLVPERCRKLLGPKYSLLRREFQVARQNLRRRTGGINRILVFFAGADRTNETAKALMGIRHLGAGKIVIDVVVAAINLHGAQVQELMRTMPNASLYCQPENLAELMAKADLSIGASGSTTWERCCLGLPTLVAPLAENQEAACKELAELGAVFTLGSAGATRAEDYSRTLRYLIRNPALLESASRAAANLVDGQGASRCASTLEAIGEAALGKGDTSSCEKLCMR